MTAYCVGKFPLILRPHRQAKYLKLRFDARRRAAVVTVPPGISTGKARQFAQKHQDWLERQNNKSPAIIPLVAREIIPYQGRPVKIIHIPDEVGAIKIEQTRLIIGGPLPGLDVRLGNWLKKQTRQAVVPVIENFVPVLGQRPRRIMVRDTKSRWGSCSSKKTLSFCWRLILAPPDILHYVVAHEMAHLVEMNHSPEFWAVVERLFPDWKTARQWLKSEGERLMLIG